MAQIKKPKLEVKDEVDAGHDAQLDATLAAQNKEFFRFRDQCEKHLSKKELIAILVKNKQTVPEGTYAILDAIADLLTFGALAPCTECPHGQLVFSKSTYVCTGDATEWLKCDNVVREPKRSVCRIPKDLADSHRFLAGKMRVQARAVRFVPSTVSAAAAVKKEEALVEGPKIKRERPPLYNLEFAVIGRLTGPRAELKAAIEKLGGRLVTKTHARLAAVVASEKEVEKMSEKMQEMKGFGVQVIRETFVTELAGKNAIEYIQTQSICDWGTDVSVWIGGSGCSDSLINLPFECSSTAAGSDSARRRAQVQVEEPVHQVGAQVGHAYVEK